MVLNGLYGDALQLTTKSTLESRSLVSLTPNALCGLESDVWSTVSLVGTYAEGPSFQLTSLLS